MLVIIGWTSVFIFICWLAFADEVDEAAWRAKMNTALQYSEPVYDCDDHAKFAYDYLTSHGKYAAWQFCERRGQFHVFIHAGGGRYIDNSSSRPVTLAEVGCDE